MTTSSVSITQGLNNSSKISTQRSLWSQRHQSRETLCHTDLPVDISNGDLACSIFDKRNASDFDTVKYPKLSGNISTEPAHGTYISQLIRYSRACHNYNNFSSQHSMLAKRLFNQGFSARKLMRTFYKFMGGYPELASKSNKSPSSTICDSAPMAQSYHTFPQLMKYS